MSKVNDEFGVDDEGLSPKELIAKKALEEAAAAEAEKDMAAKASAKKPAPQKTPPAPKQKFIDPEDDRENWPTIRIELEDGKPNYEFISVHGTKQDGSPVGHDLQVMRGVDVKVPPSVVNALREAVSAHYVPRRDPQTGRNSLERQDRSAIPWQLVRAGKYIR